MKPIVTPTMNPALDISLAVERVEKKRKLRGGDRPLEQAYRYALAAGAAADDACHRTLPPA